MMLLTVLRVHSLGSGVVGMCGRDVEVAGGVAAVGWQAVLIFSSSKSCFRRNQLETGKQHPQPRSQTSHTVSGLLHILVYNIFGMASTSDLNSFHSSPEPLPPLLLSLDPLPTTPIPDDSPLSLFWQGLRVRLENLPSHFSVVYKAPPKMMEILNAFIAYTPPSQVQIQLQSLQGWGSYGDDGELFKIAVLLAQVAYRGLQAAVTRFGSSGNSSMPTPDWLLDSSGGATVSRPRNENTAPTAPEHSTAPEQSTESTAPEHSSADGNRRNPPRSARPCHGSHGSSVLSTPSLLPDWGFQYPRESEKVEACRRRDRYRCVITANIRNEVAHIFPYSSCAWSCGFDTLPFWIFLCTWIGDHEARKLWEYVGGSKAN
ncbi:hypothetical protein DFH27DRAFT_529868 [Peziza echinospora]|nr:hypothetical protein DFH27DRAFT_529868 [Peziza echinospora]